MLGKYIYAVKRYFSQEGSGEEFNMAFIQKLSLGRFGLAFKDSGVSRKRLSALFKLQPLQHATILDHSWLPPLDFGIIWSTLSAGEPQYWHL